MKNTSCISKSNAFEINKIRSLSWILIGWLAGSDPSGHVSWLMSWIIKGFKMGRGGGAMEMTDPAVGLAAVKLQVNTEKYAPRTAYSFKCN